MCQRFVWCNFYVLAEAPDERRNSAFGLVMGTGRFGGILSTVARRRAAVDTHVAFVLHYVAFVVGGFLSCAFGLKERRSLPFRSKYSSELVCSLDVARSRKRRADVTDLAFFGRHAVSLRGLDEPGPRTSLDMSSQERPRRVGADVGRDSQRIGQRLLGVGDEDAIEEDEAEDEEESEDDNSTRVDLEGRWIIAALRCTRSNYFDLGVAKRRVVSSAANRQAHPSRHRARTPAPRTNCSASISRTAKSRPSPRRDRHRMVSTDAPSSPGQVACAGARDRRDQGHADVADALDTSGLKLLIDPPAESAQIFEEVCERSHQNLV